MQTKKIMFFDIETSPNIVYTWGIGPKVSIDYKNIIEERKIICICWKFLGYKKVHSVTWDPQSHCDLELLKKFGEVLRDCQVAIGHNGDNFDLKTIKARNMYHSLPPITNVTSIDTLKLARSNFRYNSNRLDYLAMHLKDRGKMDTGGFQLWIDVMNNQKTALTKMVKYCKRDVEILEDVFMHMLPYTDKLPLSLGVLFKNDRASCPACGGVPESKGTRAAKIGLRQRWVCTECGHNWTDSRTLKK